MTDAIDCEREVLRSGIGSGDGDGADDLRKLCAGNHTLDARHRFSRGRVEPPNLAVSDVAALEGDMEQPGRLQVIHIGSEPLNEARVLPALDAFTDELREQRLGW